VKRQKGFTLIELIIVIGMIGIMMAVAIPEFRDWRVRARYNDAAQSVAAALREARTKALSRNVQHRVEFDMANRQYRITQGSRAINSPDADFTTVVQNWTVLSPEVLLRGAADCSVDTTLEITFSANGTGTQNNICIMSATTPPIGKYRVGVQSATTGRIEVVKL
jgi:prepilin-type N-terminal cleavage/methylation domain-containing protein